MSPAVLRLDKLAVTLPRQGRPVPVVEDLSFAIEAGEMLALVGESGSGKSVAALSIPRLLPAGAAVSGSILLGGQELAGLPEAAMRRVRGCRIGMMFQDPLASLNPSHSVGAQIAEPMIVHMGLPRGEAWSRAVDLLAEMGIENAPARARCYPHQFSGGMRQRVMLALALACGPDLLIADEPTTGLDAALKTQILDLLGRLRRERRLAVLLISHDLALVRRHAESVHVLYAGRMVERGPAACLFASPRHPYTASLLQAAPILFRPPTGIPGQLPGPEDRPPGCRFAPRCDRLQPSCTIAYPALAGAPTQAACLFPLTAPASPAAAHAPPPPPDTAPPLLHAANLGVRYPANFLGLHAATVVKDASLSLAAGECLAVIGASGSGKTSLGRAILQMLPYEGTVTLRGAVLGTLRGRARRDARRRIGAVFQNPAESLNPAMTVADLIGEALYLGGEHRRTTRRKQTVSHLEAVGLGPSLLDQFPAALSGGQAQRVAIARALAANPDLLVLDEPTSCLDVSSQAVVLNLLHALQTSRGLSLIVITHDLPAISFMAQTTLEMRNGALTPLSHNVSPTVMAGLDPAIHKVPPGAPSGTTTK